MIKIKPGTKFESVDKYISVFPENIQTLLQQLRTVIKESAPQAEEMISYNIPAFKLNGMLVFFAAYEKHIGFYPTSSAIKVFKNELNRYQTSKGAVQFPIEKGIPIALVKKIVKYRVKENMENASKKK